MKKILHVLNTGSFSGAENVVITIIKEINKNYSNDISCIYVSLKGDIQKKLECEKINYEVIDKLSISEMKRVKKKYQPDIVHAHDFTASIICACAMGKTPVISHIHNNTPWIKKLGIKSIVYGITCLKYKNILGVSESVFNEFIFGKLFSKKEHVISNPIAIDEIIKKAEESSDNSAYGIVFLGRLTRQKNPFLFINIINEVNKKIPITAIMIGDGELKNSISAKIKELNLNNVINLKGFMENPYGILKQSKLLCMPSVWEGFGLAAVEALTLGTPVLASGVGGLKNIVNESCGKICSSKKEYVNEIVRLINNNSEYIAKQKNAYTRAEKLNNIDVYIKKLIEIYK